MYKVSVSRTHSGMEFERDSMSEVLQRISMYDEDFPGEIISVTIQKSS